MLWPERDTDRYCRVPDAVRHRFPGDVGPDAFGGVQRDIRRGCRDDDDELLAAYPERPVLLPHAVGQGFRQQDQDLVAHRVAEYVVDSLEMIQV
ncbi:hypothetical protein D3C86_1841600 [compost metagenome]